jgi:hypothetical protein
VWSVRAEGNPWVYAYRETLEEALMVLTTVDTKTRAWVIEEEEA